MKKLLVSITIITCLVFLTLTGVGCKEEAAAEEETTVEETTEEEAAEEETVVEEELTIGLLSMIMSIVWEQDMEAELKAFASESNATILTMDANMDPALQLQQLDNMIGQEVDGVVVFIADQEMSKAIANKCEEADLALIAESIRMIDENGKLVCPNVELDGYGMGVICAEWIAQYLEDNNITDYETVGFIDLDQADVTNIWDRANGVEDTFKELVPDFPEENFIRSPMDREKAGALAGFDAAMATITAHPEIDTWLVTGPNDDQGGGAVRALEQVGLDENACVVSMGAESARDEWKKEEDTCWKAASFFSAYDCANLVWEGMMQILREGKDPKDVYSEFKEEGQDYGLATFTGQMVTKADFREIMGKYAE
ncbi:MAG: substrate-binding domain-containing protein [Actinomycetota bacterium]